MPTAPAALTELLPELTAPECLARVVAPLIQALLAFERDGFAPFQARFAARDALAASFIALQAASLAYGASSLGFLRLFAGVGDDVLWIDRLTSVMAIVATGAGFIFNALLLREMQARELVICGLATDMCVQLTAGDARSFLRQLPAGEPPAEDAVLRWLAREYGVPFARLDELEPEPQVGLV